MQRHHFKEASQQVTLLV